MSYVSVLILTLCALSFESRAQEARIVERLADGSYVVQIGGVEHRALSAEKIIQLAEQKMQLKACQDAALLTGEKLTLREKEAAALDARLAAQAEQIAALNEVIKQLSAQPRQSKTASALGVLFRIGELGWRVWATAK